MGPSLAPRMVLGGPFTVPWMVRGEHLKVAMDGPGEPIIGGDHPKRDRSQMSRRRFRAMDMKRTQAS